MNWTIYGIQVLGLCASFTALVVTLLTKDPESFASSWPPEIQKAYYASQNKQPPKGKMTGKELARKLTVSVLWVFLFAWLASAAGAKGYWQSAGVILSYVLAVAAWDTFVLDWGFACRVRRWRLPGTEHMDREYSQKWFHVKVLFPMIPIFLLAALLSAGIRIWLF